MGSAWDFLQLFRKGRELADAQKWKQHQITATSIGLVLMAFISVLRSFFGIDIALSDTQAELLGSAVLLVFNLVLTVITSKRAGIGKMSSDSGV